MSSSTNTPTNADVLKIAEQFKNTLDFSSESTRKILGTMFQDTLESEERWEIRPSGDFPICVGCDNICRIVDEEGEFGMFRKFAINCIECETANRILQKQKLVKKLVQKPTKKKLIIKKKPKCSVCGSINSSVYQNRFDKIWYCGVGECDPFWKDL